VIFSGDTTLTSVSTDAHLENKPHSVSLKQNYPNPFNESTVIEYEIAAPLPTRTVLEIYNILGKKVATLVDEHQSSGVYYSSWDGQDRSGNQVASGIYFCQLQVGDNRQLRKLLLMR
jgi:flagellar hook assembly protein FlgD